MTEKNAWGIASMVCGILSVVMFIMPYFTLPLGVMAIIFYGIQRKIKTNGIATAGLITGIIGFVMSVIMFVLLFIVFAIAGV